MKRKIFLLGLLTVFLSVPTMRADEWAYPYLTFETTGGEARSVAVESLSLVMSGGQLVLTNASGTQTFALSELSKMYFSTSAASGIDALPTDLGRVEVFTPSGLAMGSFETLGQARAALSGGIYLVRAQQRTFKIIVR